MIVDMEMNEMKIERFKIVHGLVAGFGSRISCEILLFSCAIIIQWIVYLKRNKSGEKKTPNQRKKHKKYPVWDRMQVSFAMEEDLLKCLLSFHWHSMDLWSNIKSQA